MSRKVILSVVTVVVLALIGALVWAVVSDVEEDNLQSERSKAKIDDRVEAVIDKAERFRPPAGTACLTVMTAARHTETGATYTFPSSCLPAGWVPTRQTPPADPAEADEPTEKPSQTSTEDSGKTPSSNQTQSSRLESEKAKALREAEKYQPPAGQACTMVMTLARHIKTAVTYTFSSGCIPKGWEAVRTGDNSLSPRQ